MKKILALVFFIISLLVGNAYGGMTAEEWINGYNDPRTTGQAMSLLRGYIAGIANGIETMDAMFEAEGHNIRFFCVPNKLALTTNQRIQMLKGNLEVNPSIGKYTLGIAMFDSYKYTFPCKD